MYGILNLIRKMYGRPAMRRVMEIMKRYPESRPVQTVQGKGAPSSWYETGEWGGRGGFAESSRLAAAEGLAEGSSRYLNPYSGMFMNYMRKAVGNDPQRLRKVLDYARIRPDKAKIMDDWYRETGGQDKFSRSFLDDFIREAERTDITDHEKYMLALARQRKQKAQKGAEIIPFPRKD